MESEIIAVGTEILLGSITNTNAQYLSEQMALLGYDMYHQSVVGDNYDRIVECVKTAVGRSDVVIMTGGLGPTPDDLSKEAAAGALGLDLYEDKESLRSIEDYFGRIGRKMSECNRKQALFPKERCVIFPNDSGTAPGCAMTSDSGSEVILMPGVPSEMKMMFERYVKPYLAKKTEKIIFSRNLLVSGLGESLLASIIPEFLEQTDPTVSPYCKIGLVTLRVTSSAKTADEAKIKCDSTVSRLKNILGRNVCGTDCGGIEQTVVEGLKAKGLKLAVAESCTAGKISAAVTSVPGASEVFDFGASTYSNAMKEKLLNVDRSILASHGAVSAETACAMSAGIRDYSGADIGLSVTGVAGPAQSENKPAGLVYISLSDKTRVWVEKLMVGRAENDRNRVRESAVVHALDLVRRYLAYYPEVMPDSTDPLNPQCFMPEDAAFRELNAKNN